ncbi:hypothetical protein SAMN02910453_0469 [Lachnospiraceae bacterium A10]|nr:hypothetical protein SAMN02910453_0469 [Lachnospiraceae bacterium A10]
MIRKIVLLIIYLWILPLAVGNFVQKLIWNRINIREKNSLLKIWNLYVSGIMVMMCLFELAGKMILNLTQSYTVLLRYGVCFFRILLLISILSFIFSVYRTRKVSLKTYSFRGSILKVDIRMCVIIGIYIMVAVLCTLPNDLDDTIPYLITMEKTNVVAVFDPYREIQLSGMDGHTKLIELFYAVLADAVDIDKVRFTEYIISTVLLIFFFGIYKRIESIFFFYNKEYRLGKRYLEYVFIAICTALFFVEGSLVMSVPQNIWNGTTLMASCIMPLAFIYGYSALFEWMNGDRKKSIFWMLQMCLLMPVAALVYDEGYKIVFLLIIITMTLLLIYGLRSFFRMKEGD